MTTQQELELQFAQSHAKAKDIAKATKTRGVEIQTLADASMSELLKMQELIGAIKYPPPSPDPDPGPIIIDPDPTPTPIIGDYGVAAEWEPKVIKTWKDYGKDNLVLEPGKTLEDFEIKGDGKGGTFFESALLGHGGKYYLDDVIVRNGLLFNGEKWGMRNWGSPVRKNVRMSTLTIRNIWDEHGIYLNIAGFGPSASKADLQSIPCLELLDCLIENMGSQAIQTVQRDHEAAETIDLVADMTPGGVIRLQHVLARDVGHTTGHPIPGGRPSFSYSFFSSRNALELTDIHLDNTMNAFARGAFLAHGYDSGYERVMLLADSSFKVGHLEQNMMQLWYMGKVEIIDTEFLATAGQNWIDFTGQGSLKISGCKGTTRIRVNGEDVGSVQEGYQTQA